MDCLISLHRDIDEIAKLIKCTDAKIDQLHNELDVSLIKFKEEYPFVYALHIVTEKELITDNRFIYAAPLFYGYYTNRDEVNKVKNNTLLGNKQSFLVYRQPNMLNIIDYININTIPGQYKKIHSK